MILYDNDTTHPFRKFLIEEITKRCIRNNPGDDIEDGKTIIWWFDNDSDLMMQHNLVHSQHNEIEIYGTIDKIGYDVSYTINGYKLIDNTQLPGFGGLVFETSIHTAYTSELLILLSMLDNTAYRIVEEHNEFPEMKVKLTIQ